MHSSRMARRRRTKPTRKWLQIGGAIEEKEVENKEGSGAVSGADTAAAEIKARVPLRCPTWLDIANFDYA